MKFLSFCFRKAGAVCYKLFRLFLRLSEKTGSTHKSVSEQNKQIWYKQNGDKTLRVEYNLSPDSVVYDVGGYEGDWAAEIAARYACAVYVFEPVALFVEQLKKRFRKNERIHILPYGLDGKDGEMMISALAEASSVFRDEDNHNHKAAQKEKISIRAINAVMTELGTKHIDLIKINIEGGEYGLLECLLDNDLIGSIDNLQIQFHDFVPDAEKRMNAIKARLGLTHELTYEYIFVWENWKKKVK